MHPENELVDVLKRLYKNNLTSSSGGNLSMKDKNGVMWITPASIDKGNLYVKDLVRVLKEDDFKGKHKPSSEYQLHQAIYKICPEIKAILHAHPPLVVAYCISGEKLNTAIQPDIFKMCGEIANVPYICPGTKKLADAVSAEFNKGFSIVMMENHGVVVADNSITEAYHKIVMLNICAESYINAKHLGKINMLNSEQLDLVENPVYLSKSVKTKLFFINYDLSCNSLLLMARRAFEHNLITGNLGSISLRKNNDSVLISQKSVDWELAQYEDFLFINELERLDIIYKHETMPLIKRIYQKNPEIKCIIHSYAPYCFAFSLSDAIFDTKTVPESFIVLKDVVYADYESCYTNIDKISDDISYDKPLVFIKNNGIIVTGNSISQAFDRIEVAEFTAKSLITAKLLGNVKTIEKEEIDKIKTKYAV